MNNILEIKNANKSFGNFQLKDISFNLKEGFIMGFIGPNGAGKTTTIKLIMDMISLDSGNIDIFGLDHKKNIERIKDDIGLVMDYCFYVDEWKVSDVEKAVKPFYSRWDHLYFLRLLDKFQIDPKKKVKELSHGMKMKLTTAVALSHYPKLLILDEPTSGLDPVARDELMDILREFICDENKGVLFSTHITTDLEKTADYITYIRNGKIIYSDEKDKLLEEYSIIKGNLSALSIEDKKHIIGYREYNNGFDGLIETKMFKILPKGAILEAVTLDEIVVRMNKEGGF